MASLYLSDARCGRDGADTSTLVESFGKIWLYTIAEETWRPSAGERIAMLGPFPVTGGTQYTARYMEAVFTPGMRAAIHRHSGPEAWYLVSGAQCLETPDGITVAHAGEGAAVPEGPPMALSSVGTETRRSCFSSCMMARSHGSPGWRIGSQRASARNSGGKIRLTA
ncbi:MAG TPA: hypothetical protein VGU20_24350 [Stellaceae bacterium]|nr:hypothetical protein [Stellaceae bacterium]